MPSKDTKIVVLGNGGWGTTLALLLAQNGYRPSLWGASSEYVEEMKKRRENVKFLPGFKIPASIELISDAPKAVADAEWIVLAAPSQYMRPVVRKLRGLNLKRKSFVIVSKGIETGSLKTMSEVVREELGSVSVAVLSGPTIARDVAMKYPSAASVASKSATLAEKTREAFMTDTFVLFTTSDVIGVELGGSVKNVLAIASGIVQGLGYGSNTRAVLFARGVAEMARLGQTMGARRETFMGLSGLGDLATTCLSPHSRNRSLGEEIGKGKALKKILGETEMVVEGVDTALATYRLAKKLKVKMPIAEAVHDVLFRRRDPKVVVQALMCSDQRNERE